MAQVLLPIAADTSYLLRLAEGDDDAWDALEVLGRLRPHPRIATRTVLAELAHHARTSTNPRLALEARRALECFARDWGFEPGHKQFPLHHDQIEALARELIRRNVLPKDERQDALVLAEAAFSGAFLLVSEDSHLRHADAFQLSICLRAWKLRPPVILTARELVKTFYR